MRERISVHLLSLPDIEAVHDLDLGAARELWALEKRYAESALVPLRNHGMETALGRKVILAVLKTAAFRPPPIPSVYMVEELEGPPDSGASSAPILMVGRTRYAVIGEELIGSREPPQEPCLNISEDFVMFPSRRRDRGRPVLFLLPPVPFPELEERRAAFRITNIVSASPCSTADDHLRGLCGFSTDNRLGTLIVAFDPLE